MTQDFKCQRLSRKTENGPIFNTGTLWQPPLKMEILKIRFFHVTRGPKIGIEPNFHDHRTSNVKDYPGKPKMGTFLTLGPYGSPP